MWPAVARLVFRQCSLEREFGKVVDLTVFEREREILPVIQGCR